jgi:hypothetical protein
MIISICYAELFFVSYFVNIVLNYESPEIIKKSGVCLLILFFISNILCLYTKNFNIIIMMYYYRKYYLIVYHTSLQLQLSPDCDCDWTIIFLNVSMNTIVKAPTNNATGIDKR